MNSWNGRQVVYVCADPGISWHGSKGASVHVREICTALQEAGARVRVMIARTDGAEAAPEIERFAHDSRSLDALAAEPADLVWERYSLGESFGPTLARAAGAEYWLEINAPLIEEASTHRSLDQERERAERRRLRQLLETADRVLVVSPALVGYALENGAPRRTVEVLPNGFSASRFRIQTGKTAARAAFGIPETATVFVFAGGFRAWHGVDLLLEAFDRLQVAHENCLLVLAGDGPLRKQLAPARLQRPGILDFGHLAAARLPLLLFACDVGVSPTLPEAGDYFCPLKILEYQAANLAVVTTPLQAAVDAVEGGRCGAVLPRTDVGALYEALLLLARDPAQVRSLADAGFQKAWREGSWAARLAQLLHRPAWTHGGCG